MANVRIDT
jgi:hypothetical protein